ncbi:MAG: hypothetical protein Q8Q42_03585 [Nanoarchaeota archaeon]|nr:hypothetical protein [Nanoarchaeota archaeon]
MKSKKSIALFMILLVFTLPISVYGQITGDQVEDRLKSQASDIADSVEHSLTGPTTLEDIIGEDIVINVVEYQPDIIRAGLIEDQGIVVYAVLKGTPSNPSITIPRIKDVDIISYEVKTNPPDAPVTIGRIAHIQSRNQILSYDNMGYLAIPISRIPKEKDVPESIDVSITARILFDVSSGLGASPSRMVLSEQSYNDWLSLKDDSKYLNTYIQANDIKDNEVVFNIYDETLRPIKEGITIKKGGTSPSIKRYNYYSPGSLFDEFKIQLTDIRSAGKTLDILVVRNGNAETHTITEGESIYPGSKIILERVEERGDLISAVFRNTAMNTKETVSFPKNMPQDSSKFDINSITSLPSTIDILCGDPKKSITEVIIASNNILNSQPNQSEYAKVHENLKECIDIIIDLKNTQNPPTEAVKENMKGIQAVLSELESKSTKYEPLHAEVAETLESFIEEYQKTFPAEKLVIGTSVTETEAAKLYKKATEQYEQVVATYKGETVNIKGDTNIADFIAQYNKALIEHVNLKNIPDALESYKKLLEIFNSYDPPRMQKASGIIDKVKILKIISLLDTILSNPSLEKSGSTTKFQEENGEIVQLTLIGSNLVNFEKDKKPAIAHIRTTDPRNPSKGLSSYALKKGEQIPNSDYAKGYPWWIKDILASSIIISTATLDRKEQTITITQNEKEGKTFNVGIPGNTQIGAPGDIKPQQIILESTDLNKEAHITVIPNIEAAFSGSTFNLHLEIEKRAFELPLFSDTIEEEINSTEQLIQKLDEVLVNVEKVHNTWKTFCFAVYAVIAAWNLIKTIFGSGQGKAKQQTSEIFQRQYGDTCASKRLTFDECVFEYEDEYNTILKNAEASYDYAESGVYTGNLENFSKGKELPEWTKADKADLEDLAYLQKTAELNPEDTTAKQKYFTAYDTFMEREDHNRILKRDYNTTESRLTPQQQNDFRGKLFDAREKRFNDAIESAKPDEKTILNSIRNSKLQRYAISANLINQQALSKLTEKDKEELKTTLMKEGNLDKGQVDVLIEKLNHVHYSADGNRIYFENTKKDTVSSWSTHGSDYKLTDLDLGETIKHSPQVTYYEEGTNAGKVHRITIDAYRYLEIEYSTGGRISKETIFQRSEPNRQMMADSTEAPVGEVNIVLEDAKKNKKDKLIKDINNVEGCVGQLNRGKIEGKDLVSCAGNNYLVSNDAVKKGVACVDFYSPDQCKLLFNACDPVLCPSSRCDLGGTWRVKDNSVIQTGIIGSSVLCLSNFGIPGTDIGTKGGKVVMPICITGIYAGLQNLQTVLMEYRDCLKTALVEGESVAVCDLIRSYYICDLLWKEAMAILNVENGLLGGIINVFTEGDEGTEYTNFEASMDQMTGGLEYFTQNYAKGTFAQFSGGSLPEVGGEICKAAIFGQVPGMGSFTDQIMRPESPPQFTALLDSTPYSDIPDQPVSEYQVYYRMYAGANEPVSFSVYLRYEGLGSQTLPILSIVQNKALAAGAFDAATRNFQAPGGYNQVCVRYQSQTYGIREECGFGKTSSSFALEYAANSYAQKAALQDGIQSAEDCVPTGSRFTSPSAGFMENTAALAAGGLSSGVLDSGIIRVCSGITPGNPNDWKIVGECYEDGPKQGRSLGACWLNIPSAKKVILEYSAWKNQDIRSFDQNISIISEKAINELSDYVKQLSLDAGYLDEEGIKKAQEQITTKKGDLKEELTKEIGSRENPQVTIMFQEAANTYTSLIESPVATSVQVIQFRMELAEIYKQWAQFLEEEAIELLADSRSEGSASESTQPLPPPINIITLFSKLEDDKEYIILLKTQPSGQSIIEADQLAFIDISEAYKILNTEKGSESTTKYIVDNGYSFLIWHKFTRSEIKSKDDIQLFLRGQSIARIVKSNVTKEKISELTAGDLLITKDNQPGITALITVLEISEEDDGKVDILFSRGDSEWIDQTFDSRGDNEQIAFETKKSLSDYNMVYFYNLRSN